MTEDRLALFELIDQSSDIDLVRDMLAYERVCKFMAGIQGAGSKIVGVDWLPGGDELTPTLKVKRSVVYEKYKSEIDELYEA